MKLPIYFFGDNHFTPNPHVSNNKKIQKLKDFINLIDQNGGSIFIMGDFFDYYFEYKKNNPSFFNDLLDLFDRIKNKGIDIYFIAGNHDYWIGQKFRSSVTQAFLKDQILVTGKKRIFVTHGDGLLSWDWGYRMLRLIIRSKLVIFIYSLLPKALAFYIANKVSYLRKDSHRIDKKILDKIHNELINFARIKWAEGCDIVIMGHYHHSFYFEENNKELIILADCSEKKFNYAKYDGETISIDSL